MVQIQNGEYPNHSNYNTYFEWFDFPLSNFQKFSIQAIVDGNHSLVTAHTGSGKTLPAEFAIRYFCSAKKRVIYTSPIKALSNQKYYDFSQKFPHISFGVITGDVKFNPDAEVLIMTTEVLENCLRGGKNITVDFLEVGAVIFDEVHYINDAERGGVWENTILLLPPHVQLIMLSATIDAPERFADWVECRHKTRGDTKCVVLSSTDKRVVPLVHYTYITTNETVYKTTCKGNKELEQFIRANTNNLAILKTARGEFQDTAFSTLRRTKQTIDDVKINRQHVLNQLVVKLRNEDMMPAIMFVFSRKMVEKYASEITANLFMAPLVDFDPTAPRMDIYDDSKIPYIVARECEQLLRSKIVNFREYLELPEYRQLVALLEKGIAIHHSGMIPILREIVEFMISRKYVKLLFATESFAIGLDCPIKTAVFTSLTKFDGNTERLLYPHEYSQMAGRAGRRGMDKIGHVIHCNNLFDLPTATEYKHIMCGAPQKLTSKFNIDYKLILKNASIERQTPDEFVAKIKTFIEGSMLHRELIQQYEGMVKEIAIISEKIDKKRENIKKCHKTPLEISMKYIDTVKIAPTLVNKKRREKEREIAKMEEEYPRIKSEIIEVQELLEMQEQLSNMEVQTYDEYIDNIIECEIRRLEGMGYMDKGCITYMGELARNIGELNGLELSYAIVNIFGGKFQDYTTDDMIILLSCFVDIRDSNGDAGSIKSDDNSDFIKRRFSSEIEKMKNAGLTIYVDMIPHLYNWLIEDHPQINISKGEWIKAIKKVCNVVKEIDSVVVDVEFKKKLNEVEKVRKGVVSEESIYI